MEITAVIVDDESQSRSVLQSLLRNFAREIRVAGEAAGAAEAFELINELRPQLVFLDIQMPRANGFTLLQKFETVPFEVIFVTSFDKYAINAIKFSALDYLLKPVEVSDLEAAVAKAVKRISEKQNNGVQIVNLLHNLDAGSADRKIAVHAGDRVRFIASSDIVSIESDGSYCNLSTLGGERFTTAKYLKEFEDYFGADSNFVRIHKSCLINVSHIKSYCKGEPCIIEMSNQSSFEVARRKKQEILEKVKRHAAAKG